MARGGGQQLRDRGEMEVADALRALLAKLDQLERDSEDGWRIRIIPTIAERADAERALKAIPSRDEEHVGYWDAGGFLPLTALPVHGDDQRRFFERARPLFAVALATSPDREPA